MGDRCKKGTACTGCDTCCPMVGSWEEQQLPGVIAKREAKEQAKAQANLDRAHHIVRELKKLIDAMVYDRIDRGSYGPNQQAQSEAEDMLVQLLIQKDET